MRLYEHFDLANKTKGAPVLEKNQSTQVGIGLAMIGRSIEQKKIVEGRSTSILVNELVHTIQGRQGKEYTIGYLTSLLIGALDGQIDINTISNRVSELNRPSVKTAEWA